MRDNFSRLQRQARVLERTTVLVQDVTMIISEDEKGDKETLGLGCQLRSPAADALRALAKTLSSVTYEGADPKRVTDLRRELDSLTHQVEARRTDSTEGMHVASNVVNSIRRILLTIT